jgi:hypothetical protein
VASADRAEEMSALYRAELVRKPEPRPTALVKLSAEIRPCEKQAVDFTARVKLGLGGVVYYTPLLVRGDG